MKQAILMYYVVGQTEPSQLRRVSLPFNTNSRFEHIVKDWWEFEWGSGETCTFTQLSFKDTDVPYGHDIEVGDGKRFCYFTYIDPPLELESKDVS